MAASLSVVCVMILLVIAAVAAVFAFRYLAENEYLGEFFVSTGAMIASGLASRLAKVGDAGQDSSKDRARRRLP